MKLAGLMGKTTNAPVHLSRHMFKQQTNHIVLVTIPEKKNRNMISDQTVRTSVHNHTPAVLSVSSFKISAYSIKMPSRISSPDLGEPSGHFLIGV